MLKKTLNNIVLGGIIAAFTWSGAIASACSVCYGDPNSPMVKGAKAGVIFLGIVVYGILSMMAGVGVYWVKRARALEQQGVQATSTDENSVRRDS